MKRANLCKQVEQQCSVCGHRFSLMYWEDGTYTYLDDPCDCQAEFYPLGPSIGEWREQINESHGYNKSRSFSYDLLNWSDRAIAQIREEAMEFSNEVNGFVEHISGISNMKPNGDLFYNDPSCWPKYVVYYVEDGSAKK